MDRTLSLRALCWIIVVGFLGKQGVCQQQFFRLKPVDTDVIEGQTAVLNCVIGNKAGAVQWTKDGFALGFETTIPGFPRYTMIGNIADGDHNLRIENTNIDDDAEFQCQVGPTADNKEIRANAHLSVLLAPTTVEIVERPTGGTIEVRQHKTLDLACVVKGGKPAATIKWYRKNIEVRMENSECSAEAVEGKRQNTRCKVKLRPTPNDNGAIYACEGNHPALPQPIRAQIKLSVLYPPERPEIEGYREGETIRMGDTVTLSCISRGGNPLARLVWLKNGAQIDFSYTTSTRESVNTYSFVVDASDNNAIYKCEATNAVLEEPLSASITFMVQFAPLKVTITGTKEAKAGDTVELTCVTDRSNPAAEVSWVVDGRPVAAKSTVAGASEGGFITTSVVNVQVTDTSHQERSMTFSCYAVHQSLGQTIVETSMVNILYAPNPPSIYGYSENTTIRAGNVQRLMCVSIGGNPLATLSWFKGDQKIPSTNAVSGNIASAELGITAKEDDNGAEYRCEATNSATGNKPLSTSAKLTVLFPPSGVVIKVSPKTPKAGRKVTLQCDSASSNPESNITWWRGGYLVQGKYNGTFDAPNGGKSTRSILRMDVTSADDGAVYTCQATNEILQQSVHDAVTLNVLYKPEFIVPPAEPISALEGESVSINMTARGNPDVSSYTWSRNGVVIKTGSSSSDYDRIIATGPVINFTTVKRDDTGLYLCEAKNEEGVTAYNVSLNVHYPAKVMKITKPFMVDEGSNAHMECEVDANPRPDGYIQWRTERNDLSRVKQTLDGHKSYLTLFSVTKDDSGIFTCVGNNKIGVESTMETTLIVKFKPILDKSPQYQKAASEKGQNAKLICRAEGAPEVSFTWAREGATIDTSQSFKHRTETNKLSLISYESILHVADVRFSDYGAYDCIARNELGFVSSQIRLDGTSHPDTPLALRIVNATHNTIWLSWTPGFDGGLPQSFRIRYKKEDAKVYAYTDVHPTNTTKYAIGNLELGSEYTFNILAYNTLGESPYTTDVVKGSTLSEIPPSEQKTVPSHVYEKAEIPRIIIIAVSVVGTFLLVLNVFLVVCFIQRRRKKRMEEAAAESDQSSNKTAATIEMYAPSSYNGTVTGETLSSISEKSESYSDENSIDDYNASVTRRHKKRKDDGGKQSNAYITDRPETTVSTVYPDNSQYLTVRTVEPVPGSQSNTLTRSPKINNNQNMYDTEDDNYADALRRNAYNQNLGTEKVNYSKTPTSPTKTPVRDGYYNISPDARYIPYPPAVAASPQRQQTPILSTFNPNPPSASPAQSPQQQNLPPEMQGHLV